jgi:hypothetical protein
MTPTAEQDMVRKVQGLLAKAERTDIKAEADAFFAKAEELMLRYAIDEARLAEFRGVKAAESKPVMETYTYSTTDNNAVGKMDLIHAAARGHRVRMVLAPALSSKRVKTCYLIGMRRDVDFVKTLYTSLLVQAMREAALAWERSDQWGGKSAYVTSFLSGYGATVHRRLQELTAAVRAEDPTGMALVDMSAGALDQAVRDFLGGTQSHTARRGASNGYGAGALAGKTADLMGPKVGSGSLRLAAGR